ncbi:MAG: helix-turn-helix domain-containing protein [Clostridia bacterium]|nr:helix-turn-helix domain-containing protein [Clostridia bacterium]
MLVENNISSNINSDKILLSVQDASRFLGVPKKVIQDLIDTGLLKAVNVSGKTYISRYALSEVTGEQSAAHFGQLASGQTIENTIYYSQQSEFTDCEDDSVFVKRYTGSVSALKDGAYMAQIDMGRSPDGKRLRPSKRFKTREEAERYLNQRLAELNGEYIHQQNPVSSNTTLEVSNALYTDMTFEEYAKMILNRGIGKAVSRTIDGYRISLVPVLESIGNVKMVDIDRDKLIGTFNNLSYRYGKVSIKKAYNTTKMIMEEAYYNELIPKNPFIRLKMPASKVEIENYRLP